VHCRTKFGVECDSPQMQDLYHWPPITSPISCMQYGMYNYGYDVLTRCWPNIQHQLRRSCPDFWRTSTKTAGTTRKTLSKGKVIPAAGLMFIERIPNSLATLAGSATTPYPRSRHRAFIERHQNQLVFGSDCVDRSGHGIICTGWGHPASANCRPAGHWRKLL